MSIDITSDIELYDHDILNIENGPMAYANAQVGTMRNLDDVVNRIKDEFLKIGFFVYIELGKEAECRCYPGHPVTQCPDLKVMDDAPFMIRITIQSRTSVQPFDYEQMQYEVRNNILNIPGQDKGTIKFDEKEFLRRQRGGQKQHRHG